MDAAKWTDIVSAFSAAVSALAAIFAQAFDGFYHHVDWCSQQIILRMGRRVGSDVWSEWWSGMAYNIGKLPAFGRAWEDIKEQSDRSKELRRREAEEFLVDPLAWIRT